MTKQAFSEKLQKRVMDVPQYNVLNFNQVELGPEIYDEAIDNAMKTYNALPPLTTYSVENLDEDEIIGLLELATAEALFITAMKHLRNQVMQQGVVVQENDKFAQYNTVFQQMKNMAEIKAREIKKMKAVRQLSQSLDMYGHGIVYD